MVNLDTILKLLDRWPAWKRLTDLPGQVEALERRIAALEGQLAEKPESPFVEARGALFKRNPDGSFQKAVYCPNCHMSTATAGLPFYSCGKCKWISSFSEQDLPQVLAELASGEGCGQP